MPRLLFAFALLVCLSCRPYGPCDSSTDGETLIEPLLSLSKDLAAADVDSIYVVVTGHGIAGERTFAMTVDRASHRYFGTISVPGGGSNWTVTVYLLDSTGTVIGQGTVQITDASAQVTVPVIAATGSTSAPTIHALYAQHAAVRAGDTIRLQATATDTPGGQIVKWEWDAGNTGSFTESGGCSVSVSAPSTAYTAWECVLRVTDNHGNTALDTTRVMVREYRGRMVRIVAGGQSFSMGSDSGDDNEHPVHTVTFTYDFWMDTTEVLWEDCSALMKSVYGDSVRSSPPGAGEPANFVNWYQAALYCNARSKREGLDTVYCYSSINHYLYWVLNDFSMDLRKNGYRLPTEAEWEYACRASTTGEYWWGNDSAGKYAWYDANSGGAMHPVAQKLPNPFGLYDMCGNLFEWCTDIYATYPDTPQTDPVVTTWSGSPPAVRRSSSWANDERMLRSPHRASHSRDVLYEGNGFRCVLQTHTPHSWNLPELAAHAGNDTTLGIGDTVHLHGSASGANTITEYAWNFGGTQWVTTVGGEMSTVNPGQIEPLVCILRVKDDLSRVAYDTMVVTFSLKFHQAAAGGEATGRYGAACVVFNHMIWLIGGVAGNETNEVWYSSDGLTWAMATSNAGFSTRQGHSCVVFDGRMWVMGGWGSPTGNDVWHSYEGVWWTQALASAPFPGRLGHTSVVFENHMWVIGGAGWGSQGATGAYFSDVWFSADGITWAEATGDAGFSPRQYHTSVVHDGRMWVIGGMDEQGDMRANDVWYSSDGAKWTQATAAVAFSARCAHTSVTDGSRMWVIAGDHDGAPLLNDIWHSTGGVTWTEATAASTFEPRRNHHSVVFEGRLWVMGGLGDDAYTPDVWYSDSLPQ